MDWSQILLYFFYVCIAWLVIYGIYYVINRVGAKLVVGNAIVVGHHHEPEREEFDHAWFAAPKRWRRKTIPAKWFLYLEVEGEQDWIEVTEGTYRHMDGTNLKVWFGRGCLNNKVFVQDFYNE